MPCQKPLQQPCWIGARRRCPPNPEAWLMTVAKPKTIDRLRKVASSAAALHHLLLQAEQLQDMVGNHRQVPDERLTLMFARAHPASDPAIETPLILQTVLGLDAAEIGSAFSGQARGNGTTACAGKEQDQAGRQSFWRAGPCQTSRKTGLSPCGHLRSLCHRVGRPPRTRRTTWPRRPSGLLVHAPTFCQRKLKP
jgi:hypothetical protein